MEKSAINILQEHCILKYKKYPDYKPIAGLQGGSPDFTIECSVNAAKSVGMGSTKSAAKTQSAERMLIKLGLTNITMEAPVLSNKQLEQASSGNIVPNGNYVGALNEFCSKGHHPFPTYTEGSEGTLFVVKCYHQGQETIGVGPQKKTAKQHSAKAMLQLCNSVQPSHVSANDMNLNAMSLLDNDYSKLMANTLPSASSTKQVKQFAPPKNYDSVSALNMYCQKYGYKMPEYIFQGKDGNIFTNKCLFQSKETYGRGLSIKFAKQDSANEMLKLLEIGPKYKEGNLINMGAEPPLKVSSTITNPLDDNEIIDMYKQIEPQLGKCKVKSQNSNKLCLSIGAGSNKDNMDGGTLHLKLRDILKENNVFYEIITLQRNNPWIITLTGKRMMSDGTVVDRHLVKMGEKHDEVVGSLLARAIESFMCYKTV